jgi:predicted TIM-barrel fold metal-dependent hydrolase
MAGEELSTRYPTAQRGEVHTLLPDPEPEKIVWPIISVDDHLVEPPDVFEGRMPSKFADRTPRIIDQPDGSQVWLIEGQLEPNLGFNAVVGRPPEEWSMEPANYDDMRPGAWDIDARLKDMDLNGIYASLNFPSHLTGFSGQRVSALEDKEFGLAMLRAWNTWHLEEWAGRDPNRIIPCQLPWLADPVVAADEILQNAEKGFKAVTFPESPDALGLPSLYDNDWDPIFAACAETGTVVCLHVGSSSRTREPSPRSPVDAGAIMFPINAMFSAVDWLFSGVPVRFPDLKIALSEGGIGWVPLLLDRLEHYAATLMHAQVFGDWKHRDISPADVLRESFWFCALQEPYSLVLHERIGTEHVMVEVDYPHADTTWPHTQRLMERQFNKVDDDAALKMAYKNAARLFRHPEPPDNWNPAA